MSIQSEIERINNAKEGIAEAISEKGVTVAEGTSIDNFPSLVRSIPQGGSGGGSTESNIFVVTADLDFAAMKVTNWSATATDIYEAYISGKIVQLRIDQPAYGGFITVTYIGVLSEVGRKAGNMDLATFKFNVRDGSVLYNIEVQFQTSLAVANATGVNTYIHILEAEMA